MRATLGRLDIDALVAPLVLALGAELLWHDAGVFVLGLALYVPVIIDTVRRA